MTWSVVAIRSMAIRKPGPILMILIILDVRMPGLLGTEIAAALKQRNPSAKIILISAFADASLREAAWNLGTTVLSKPFSPDDLFQTIDTMMSEHV